VVKVLHINTFHRAGGASLAASRLNNALNAVGLESNMLVAHYDGHKDDVVRIADSRWGKMRFWFRFILERLYFLPFEKDKSVRYAFSPAISGMDLSNHPMVLQADVIHLHWVNFGMLSIENIQDLLALNKPIVWTMHDMWAFTGGCHYSGNCRRYEQNCGKCPFLKNPHENDLSFKTLERKKESWLIHQKMAIVACSAWLAGVARTSRLFQQTSVINIPNPINTNTFKPIEKPAARTELGLNPEKSYILFAAAKVDSKLKGFSYLKEALSILQSIKPHIGERLELLVTGGGESLDDLPLVTHNLGFVKGEEKMVKIYSAATLFVIPSVEDNLPNTVMEALACGTPVAGFRTGGIPEMVDHQTNGFIADYTDPLSLAKGILWILENDPEGSLASAAREKVLKEYAETVIANRYLELYQRLVSS